MAEWKKSADGATAPSYREALARLRWPFVHAGLFSAAISLLMLTGPVYMLQIYDRVISSGSVATLMGLFVIVVVLYLFLGIYEVLRRRLLSRAGYRLDALLGQRAAKRRLSPAGDGDDPLRDLATVRNFLSGPAMPALFDLPWIPLFLAAVFLIHPWLGWLTLAGAGVVIAAAWLGQKLTEGRLAEAADHEVEEYRFVEQAQRSGEAARALGMQGALAARWRGLHDRALQAGQVGGERAEALSAFSRAFRLLLQSMLLTLGAYLALHQQITAGMIVATSILAGRALAPIDQVIAQWRTILRARAAHGRLHESFAEAGEGSLPVALPAPEGRLQVNAVTKLVPGAAPGGQRARILERIAFELAPGDGLGVIGNSAAGKSSLARVLVGAWKPEAGEVRLDGATLDQWSPDVLGRHIGYLPQQVELLAGTVAENIARFDADAEDEAIFTAARMAGIHEMILALPKGYATPVGRPGQPLSGGQVQRIGLARAIYGVPPLVILDEPVASLDAEGVQAFGAAVEILRARGSTVIVTAHGLSALGPLDQVLVLHKGRMAYFGAKEKLFARTAQSVPEARTAAAG